MPRKVSELEVKSRVELTNNYQVLTTDPTNNALHRVPVTSFRGASNFLGTTTPPLQPEDINIPDFIEGDTYTRTSSTGTTFQTYSGGIWGEATKLNGARMFTTEDFNTDLDVVTDNYLSNVLFSGDLYFNRALNLVFGPYAEGTGFRFSNTDFLGYQALRRTKGFTFQGTDAIGYDDPSIYLNTKLTTAPADNVDLIEIRSFSKPTQGDWYNILLENDQGHGGWRYEFNLDNSVTGTYLNQFMSHLGADGSGSGKTHIRDVKTWNEVLTPVQNDKKYRQGDNIFNTGTGVLYADYQEGIATTTDLGLLFSTVTILSGSVVRHTDSAPILDHDAYIAGDFIFSDSSKTPRVHGPYDILAGDDKGAWPLFAVLRPPVTHHITSLDAVPATFTGDYPELDGTMVVTGDTLRETFTPDIKAHLYSDGVTIDTVGETLDWGATKTPMHSQRITQADTVNTPERNDLIYYTDEIIRNNEGDLFRYVEGQATDELAMLLMPNLRSDITHTVVDVTSVYTPDTANNSADWGGTKVNQNDRLRVTYQDSAKAIEYTATTVVVGTGVITWSLRKNFYGTREHLVDTYTEPSVDDKVYTHGETLVNASGVRFVYQEEAVTNVASTWEFREWVRGDESFNIEGSNTEEVELVPDTSYLTNSAITPKRLKLGDVINVSVAGSTTGKRFSHRVVGVTGLVATLSPRINPAGERYYIDPSSTASTPVKDDTKYSNGDYMDNTVSTNRYVYTEGQATDDLAWTLFTSFGTGREDQPRILRDDGTIAYRLRVDNTNKIYIQEELV